MSALTQLEESIALLNDAVGSLEKSVRAQKSGRNDRIRQLSLALESEREMREKVNAALDVTINRVESLLAWKEKNGTAA